MSSVSALARCFTCKRQLSRLGFGFGQPLLPSLFDRMGSGSVSEAGLLIEKTLPELLGASRKAVEWSMEMNEGLLVDSRRGRSC